MEEKNEKTRVLVANGPRVYREVIAETLSVLRPLLEVYVAEPEALDREVGRSFPHLVICNRATETVREACLRWVVLYPDGEDRAEVGGKEAVGGATRPLAGVGIAGLLSVIDETGLTFGSPRR
jgi:hypothetical protein